MGGGNGYEVMLQVASSKFLLVRWFHEAVFICETQREKRGLRSFPPSFNGSQRPSMEEDKLFITVFPLRDPTTAA